MAQIGINVPRDGSAYLDTIRGLNATWIRIVAMPDVDLTSYFDRARALGIKVLLVLARESGADYARYQQMYGNRIDAVQVGNEPDQDGESSWGMRPVELASLGRSARAVFGPSVPIVCAGMASGHPEWMDGMDLSWATAVACHPYAKDAPNPSDLEDLPDMDVLVREYQRFGLPVLVTEWGWWGPQEDRAIIEVDDAIGWAAKTSDCAVFFYFCLNDSMVPPFGLYDSDGHPKPRAQAFEQQAQHAVSVPWMGETPGPGPTPPPEPVKADPWQYFTAQQIAAVSKCPLDAIQDNWPRLVDQLDLCKINDRPTQVAMIGTVAIETAHTFRPVREAFYLGEPEPAESWRRANLRYYPWYGRGFIQLTWEENYATYSQQVNDLWQAGGAIDLIARPDDALDPDVSAATSALYFLNHGGAGSALIPYAARMGNWREVRRLVQGGTAGLDELIQIAMALTAAPTPAPPADDKDQVIADLLLALRTLRDDTLPSALAGVDNARAAIKEADRIVKQFAGER